MIILPFLVPATGLAMAAYGVTLNDLASIACTIPGACFSSSGCIASS